MQYFACTVRVFFIIVLCQKYTPSLMMHLWVVYNNGSPGSAALLHAGARAAQGQMSARTQYLLRSLHEMMRGGGLLFSACIRLYLISVC